MLAGVGRNWHKMRHDGYKKVTILRLIVKSILIDNTNKSLIWHAAENENYRVKEIVTQSSVNRAPDDINTLEDALNIKKQYMLRRVLRFGSTATTGYASYYF